MPDTYQPHAIHMYTHVIPMSDKFHTNGSHMSATSHTHDRHMSDTCKTHVSHISYTSYRQVKQMSYTSQTQVSPMQVDRYIKKRLIPLYFTRKDINKNIRSIRSVQNGNLLNKNKQLLNIWGTLSHMSYACQALDRTM